MALERAAYAFEKSAFEKLSFVGFKRLFGSLLTGIKGDIRCQN